MAGPQPSIAAVRRAIRAGLADLPAGSHVLVAGSGGPDSTALAAGTAFVATRLGLSAGFATADQHWTADSPERAEAARRVAEELGLSPAVVVDAAAARSEGAARDARRAALRAEAQAQGAVAILLGHTLDDQAETVLLRLARGSGARSLAAMAARDDPWRRPLLALRRHVVRDSCTAAGLSTWDDPANADLAFARGRVRHDVLPLLEKTLGPGIAESLARSADLLRADADALDALARKAFTPCQGAPTTLPITLALDSLNPLLPAIRSRVVRAAALSAGCPPTALTADHVAGIEALVTSWHGQGPVSLPGGVTAARRSGTIVLTRPSGSRSGSVRATHAPAPTTAKRGSRGDDGAPGQ